jgi:FAD binding domain/Berberine and berberine like
LTAQPGPNRLGRRDVLRLGAGAAAGLLAGCATGHKAGPGPTTTPPTSTSAPPHTVPTTGPDLADWSSFGRSLSGRLVRPGDRGYLTDLQLYDSRFDSVRPAGIAYCASPSDVQRSLEFARAHSLPFAPRSGGHSYAGYSTTTGLVIDVTPMATVRAAPGATVIGAGARLIDVYSTLNAAGVSIPAGSCPTVGIAGLTLGGGVGVVDRAYGLTCDTLTAVDVVTADSRLVTASAASNPDLYWACQGGGGGNFGIATSLHFRTFATTPLTLAFLVWPWEAAGDVLPAWLEWAPPGPDQLWSNCLLETQPSEPSPKLQVGAVLIGAPTGLDTLLGQLERAVGVAPSNRSVETVPFEHAMYVEGGCASFSQAACHLPSQTPGGILTRQPSLAKSAYVNSPLGDRGVEAIVSGIDTRQSEGAEGAVGFDAYGGAINRVSPSATAFVHRSALASAQFTVPFDPATPAAQLASSQSWLNSWYVSVAPYMSGSAYQNYIDPDLPAWAQAYYGSNLGRLMQIKWSWDPDDAFHFPQSIPL